ncbi:hypothetical protein Acr_00g0018150 [Actinidia rufa]|uniref:Transposase (putative) gypsy type domain-containing protein n=1 Tax=Actinidia rufa TaxID=165716 RepID=A0A7J0DD81_9ERIC|nr:hypothetical protein Acr_00g0018150 [Actinidia rufa]
MSCNSDVTRSGDLDSLPSWISDHLGEGSSFMTDEINQSPSSPMEGSPEESPLIVIHPSVEEKINIMNLEELNAFRDAYSFPSGVQVRLPNEGETITFTRPGKVAFYEAAFPAGLRFPLHPTIRLILQFYNICPTQLVPNAWRSIACSMAQGTRRFCSEDTPVMLRGERVSSSSSLATNGRFLRERLGRAPQEFRGCGEFQISTAIIHLDFYGDKPKVFEEIFQSVEQSGRFSVPVLLDSKSYRRVFVSLGSRASRTAGDNLPSGEAPSSSSDVAMSKRVSFKKIGKKIGKTAGASSGTPVLAKGVVIGEKQAGESITSSPSKKEKADDGSKGKGVDSGPKGKKKATLSSKAPATPTVASSRLGEGTSGNLADKEKVEKLTLDQTATKLFHVIGQALVLGSSLAVRSREAGEQASLQEGRVVSMETEVVRLQKLAADLEQQLAESHAREQQANDELAKMKSDRDSLADKLERSVFLVNELREALDKAKESAMEEFKNPRQSSWWQLKSLPPNTLARGSTSARCNCAGIIPTSLSILNAPWSIKICWRSRTRLLRRKKRKNRARTRGLVVSSFPCHFFLLYRFDVNGDHELGGEKSFGEAKLATSLTAIKTPVI